jgi:DNA-binding NarL/FixJ family response regulator
VGAIGVVVADDDEVFRAALVETLASDDRFDVLGQSRDGHGLPALVAILAPRVVILDVRMPGGGPELCRAVKAAADVRPPVVVAVSAELATSTVTAILAAGATGYLGKGRLGDDLGDAVARCADGERVLAVPRARDVLRRLEGASRSTG